MSQTVSIYHMISGNIFQEIKYNDFNELCNILKLIIINHDSDILIQLLINDDILNNFGDINMSILSNLNKDNCIMILFSHSKSFFLGINQTCCKKNFRCLAGLDADPDS